MQNPPLTSYLLCAQVVSYCEWKSHELNLFLNTDKLSLHSSVKHSLSSSCSFCFLFFFSKQIESESVGVVESYLDVNLRGNSFSL